MRLNRFIMLGLVILTFTASKRGTAEQVLASNRAESSNVSCTNRAQTNGEMSLLNAAKNRQGIPAFIWPTKGTEIISLCSNHQSDDAEGIYIAVAKGAIVKAAAEGIVVYAGSFRNFGPVVVIRHNAEWFTVYSYDGLPLVKPGVNVVRGQRLFVVDRAVAANFPQLHFEIHRSGKSLNPRDYLPAQTF
jgi:murein DD-endopeptidase MepM/ murein hydrolase activator NlpD